MKTVVTHMRPDLDAIGSVWSIKRFLPGWEEAKVQFVPAGWHLGDKGQQTKERFEIVEAIGEDEVIHVDTGMGPLDHHQTPDSTTSAALRSFEFAFKQSAHKHPKHAVESGRRMMRVVVAIDHFQEVFWEDPNNDRYDFMFARILDGIKMLEEDDQKVMEFGFTCFDALFHIFKNKVWAEEEIKEKGLPFEMKWGKGLGIETINDDVMHIAQMMGYIVVIRKDPRKGYVRIKSIPNDEYDLTAIYEKLKRKDQEASWFFHVSKHMLLNGTTKNPNMVPTKLKLEEIIEVVKTI